MHAYQHGDYHTRPLATEGRKFGLVNWIVATSICVLFLSIVTTLAVSFASDQTSADLAAYHSLRSVEHITADRAPEPIALPK